MEKMRKKVVIFDLDGLMIDSERVTFECFEEVLAKTDRTISRDFYIRLIGRTYDASLKLIEEEYGDSFNIEKTVEDVHSLLAKRFEAEGVPEKQGIRDLLEYLKGSEFKIFVATSSSRDRVDTILEQSGLNMYIDGSVCGDEVKSSKPDPELFLNACRKAGCKPAEAYVLEDSEAGIEAAYAAGIDCIAVPDLKYPADEVAKKARWIVGSLSDALEIFEGIYDL